MSKYNLNIALFEPDIPQNVGTLLRLGAGLGVAVHVIEPCGFPFGADKGLKRAAMDYLTHVEMVRHSSWNTYLGTQPARIVLLTTKSAEPYLDFAFQTGDHLLLGRESAGVPDNVHNAAHARITIPMQPGMRSLNVATAGAMVIGEAIRQITL